MNFRDKVRIILNKVNQEVWHIVITLQRNDDVHVFFLLDVSLSKLLLIRVVV